MRCCEYAATSNQLENNKSNKVRSFAMSRLVTFFLVICYFASFTACGRKEAEHGKLLGEINANLLRMSQRLETIERKIDAVEVKVALIGNRTATASLGHSHGSTTETSTENASAYLDTILERFARIERALEDGFVSVSGRRDKRDVTPTPRPADSLVRPLEELAPPLSAPENSASNLRADLDRFERILDKVSANQQQLFAAQRNQEELNSQTRDLIRSGLSKILIKLDSFRAQVVGPSTGATIIGPNIGNGDSSNTTVNQTVADRLAALESALKSIHFDISGGTMPCSNEHERNLIRGLVEHVLRLTQETQQNVTIEVSSLRKNDLTSSVMPETSPSSNSSIATAVPVSDSCPERDALVSGVLPLVVSHANSSLSCLDSLIEGSTARDTSLRQAVILVRRRASAVTSPASSTGWQKRAAVEELQNAIEALAHQFASPEDGSSSRTTLLGHNLTSEPASCIRASLILLVERMQYLRIQYSKLPNTVN